MLSSSAFNTLLISFNGTTTGVGLLTAASGLTFGSQVSCLGFDAEKLTTSYNFSSSKQVWYMSLMQLFVMQMIKMVLVNSNFLNSRSKNANMSTNLKFKINSLDLHGSF